MPTTDKDFTGGAVSTSITANITAGSPGVGGLLAIADASGWPDGSNGSFVATLRDTTTGAKETLLISSRSGLNLTVEQRGYDGTTAASWSSGTVIEHTVDGASIKAYEDHIVKATAAHAASAISYAGGTGISATDVESAIDELATEKANASALASYLLTADAAELIRDTIGIALVQSGIITIAVNDAGDTITVGGSATAPDWIDIPANAFSIISGTRAEGVPAAGLLAGLSLPDAATNYYSAMVRIPTGWSTAKVELYWSPNSTNTGNCRFMSKIVGGLVDGTNLATLLTGMTISSLAGPGTAGQLDVGTGATGVSTTAGQDCAVMIGREGADGGDTFTGTAILHKARLVKLT